MSTYRPTDALALRTRVRWRSATNVQRADKIYDVSPSRSGLGSRISLDNGMVQYILNTQVVGDGIFFLRSTAGAAEDLSHNDKKINQKSTAQQQQGPSITISIDNSRQL